MGFQLRSFRSCRACGFIGGSVLFAGGTGGRPIEQMLIPPGTPRWGSGWKAAAKKHYRHSAIYISQGSVMSYRDRYLDLDPTYKDSHGLPLLRMTFDWHDNEYKMAAYSAARLEEIVRTLKPDSFATEMFKPGTHYDTRIYQSTHTTGGAIMGSNPSNSVINRYSQSWDVSNLFVNCGECHTPRGVALQVKAQNGRDGTHFARRPGGEPVRPSLRNGGPDTIAEWSESQISQFLQSGANHTGIAFGSMGDVIVNSTQFLSAEDSQLPPST